MNKLLYGLYYDASYLIHGNDLTISSSGSATFNSEGGTLTRLTNTSKSETAHVGAQSLGKTDGGSGLALSKGGRRDT